MPDTCRPVSPRPRHATLILALALTVLAPRVGAGNQDTPLVFSFDALVTQAQTGNPAYQHELGHCYADGRGCKRDYAASAKWFKAAAVQGHASAQHNLAHAYRTGEGLPQITSKPLSGTIRLLRVV